MKHRYSILFFPLHIIIDFFNLNIAFLLAYCIKFQYLERVIDPPYSTLWIIFNLVWFGEIILLKPYVYPRQHFKIDNLLRQLFLLVSVHIAGIALYWVFVKGYYYSREHLFIVYFIFLFLGIIFRIGGVIFLKEYRLRGYNNRKYVIVGYGKLASTIKSFYDSHPEMGFHFHGYFDEENTTNHAFLKGNYVDLPNYINDNKIDCVYCCLPYMDNHRLRCIVDDANKYDYQVKLLVDFRGFLMRNTSVEYHDFLPIIDLSSKVITDFRISFFKRSFDIVFSLTVLLLGAPFFLLIALITKFTSNGPIIFAQKRYGRLGQAFTIYKFRSMYIESEISISGLQHSQGVTDPRITPWGGFMRRTRLDELPQFVNVLVGKMSIVGPRPLAQYDVDALMEEVPNDFKKILSVKPGITSIGQIKFGYAVSIEEMVQRLQYDLVYPDRKSFLFDMWIIVQTVRVMLQGRGR